MEIHDDLQNVSPGVDIALWDHIYHDRDRYPRTALTTQFFSVNNLRFLIEAISTETSRQLNRKVCVVPTAEMFYYLEETVRYAPNTFDTSKTLSLLNLQVFEHEVREQYLSLRRRELFFKWFWFKDRPRVLEPPRSEQGRHRDQPLSAEPYYLQDPKSRYWNDFRNRQVYALDS